MGLVLNTLSSWVKDQILRYEISPGVQVDFLLQFLQVGSLLAFLFALLVVLLFVWKLYLLDQRCVALDRKCAQLEVQLQEELQPRSPAPAAPTTEESRILNRKSREFSGSQLLGDPMIRYNKPKLIIFVRHGESQGNVDLSAYATIGDPNVQLTEKGRQDARRAGEELAKLITQKVHRRGRVFLYVSPYTRTRETAAAIVDRLKDAGHKVWQEQEDPRLREREFSGTYQTRESIKEERGDYDKFFWRPENGESCADVYDRISMFFDTLWRDFRDHDELQDGVVICVCHGLTMRIAIMRWLHWTREMFAATRNPANGQFLALELYNSPIPGVPLNGDPEWSPNSTLSGDPVVGAPTLAAPTSQPGAPPSPSCGRCDKRYGLCPDSAAVLFGSREAALRHVNSHHLVPLDQGD